MPQTVPRECDILAFSLPAQCRRTDQQRLRVHPNKCDNLSMRVGKVIHPSPEAPIAAVRGHTRRCHSAAHYTNDCTLDPSQWPCVCAVLDSSRGCPIAESYLAWPTRSRILRSIQSFTLDPVSAERRGKARFAPSWVNRSTGTPVNGDHRRAVPAPPCGSFAYAGSQCEVCARGT
jgi:hypothetical protein